MLPIALNVHPPPERLLETVARVIDPPTIPPLSDADHATKGGGPRSAPTTNMTSTHPPSRELPPSDAAAHSPATRDSTQSIDRTSTSDSSFGALSEVLSSTVGVAPKHLPRFGVGERNQAHENAALEDADVARDDPAPSAPAPPSLQEGETLHPAPPRPIPCEAFEINMDILREIIAEQRAAPPGTPTIPHVARASSTTLPYLTVPEDGACPAHTERAGRVSEANAHPERPASALSITSAKSGVPGSPPHESPGVGAQVEAWSAGVADAARPAGPADEGAPPRREPATPLSKGVVEPLHGGFYLAEPSPTAAAGTPVSPTGERALPRLSHSDVEGDGAQESHTGEDGEGADEAKRVSLATRLRGEAKVLAGKLKNDDAKVAEGRALKSGEAP